MKLAALVISLVFASLSFGQSSLQIQSPSGPVQLSATSISGVAADKERALLEHLKLATLDQQWQHSQSRYPADPATVQKLESEIRRSEASTMAADTAARRRDDGIIQLRGSVEIRTNTMILTADEADYNTGSGEIEARGSVRVKLISK